MKKATLKAIGISSLISALLFGLQIVIVGGVPVPRTAYYPGDSYTTVYRPTEVPPANDTKLPIITIASPANWSITSSNNLTLKFNLTMEASSSHYPVTLDSLCYKPSWQPDNISLEIDSQASFTEKTFSFTTNIANAPNGTNTIKIYAQTVCEYETSRELVRQPISQSGFLMGNFLYIYSDFYTTAGSSSVTFTVDPSANEESKPQPPEPPAGGLPTVFLIVAGTLVGVTVLVAALLCFNRGKHMTQETRPVLCGLSYSFGRLFAIAFLACCSSQAPRCAMKLNGLSREFD